MEYKFTVYIYPLDEAQAEALRERLEKLILAEVERSGNYMGPLLAEINPQETDDGETGT